MSLSLAVLLVAPAIQSPSELHGVWFSTADARAFATQAAIAEAMDALLDAGANVVFVPAWSDGVASFRCVALKDGLGIEPPERDVLDEIVFEAHRVGLEVVPWFEPGIACSGGSEAEIAKRRPGLLALGPDGKPIVENGVAKIDLAGEPGRKLAGEIAVEVATNFDVDGIVASEILWDQRQAIAAAGDRGVVVLLPAAAKVEGAEASLVLPPLDGPDPDPDQGGSHLVGYARLRANEGELLATLRGGAWAEPARIPWRAGKVWRRPAQVLDPVAGEGSWNWAQKAGEPEYLALDGGQSGHATWSFSPKEEGVYSLYAWFPPRTDQTSRAIFTIATAQGSPARVTLDSSKRQGWVRLGNTRLKAGAPSEIARLLADEEDATKVTAAGPMIALLNRRAMRW